MLNKHKVTLEAFVISHFSSKELKEHLENELIHKITVILNIKKLEVVDAGELYTRKDLI